MEGKKVGKITHYFNKIGVAVIELEDTMKDGDKIKIKGATTDFDQTVSSMQIEHEQIAEAKAGQAIGMKINKEVRPGDEVFIVSE